MHRVRVGALGLACVFLFVMLAAAFLHAAGDPSVANGNMVATGNDQAPGSRAPSDSVARAPAASKAGGR